jgi:hypothetical protein
MKKRDIAILNDLERFRVLSRNDIIDLHFANLKNPIASCNSVLKRLRRDGYIEVNTDHRPYLYFSAPVQIKRDSAKIPHFLKIVKLYISLRKYENPRVFNVEPKYGKGYMEPDVFMIWKRTPFFVEIQRTVFTDKVMSEKIKRYENYYFSNDWQSEYWQPESRRVFPLVLVLTDTRYKINSSYVRFIQITKIDELIKMVQ